jgi:hypothetical protein
MVRQPFLGDGFLHSGEPAVAEPLPRERRRKQARRGPKAARRLGSGQLGTCGAASGVGAESVWVARDVAEVLPRVSSVCAPS